jgi:hypothetical protein
MSNDTRTCLAFGPTILRQTMAQNRFSGHPQQMNKVRASFQETNKFEPGQEITVGFMRNSQDSPQEHSRKVNFVLKTVEQNFFNPSPGPHQAKLRLRLRPISDTQSAMIRVSFLPQGAWSFLGKENLGIPKNQATMNLGWLDEDRNGAVVIHEWSHCLAGFLHEHQSENSTINWNVPAVLEIFRGPPNFWDAKTTEHNVFGTVNTSSTNSTVFDPLSIMLYLFDCFCFTQCKPNSPELSCTCDPGVQAKRPAGCCVVGQQANQATQLSLIDVATMQNMYPLVENPGPEIKPFIPGTETPGQGTCKVWTGGMIATTTLSILFVLAFAAILAVFFLLKK